MIYDLKKKEQPDSVYKGYYSSGSKEQTSSSESNVSKFLQNHEIRCLYKINTSNYYRNVNIYKYKKKIII